MVAKTKRYKFASQEAILVTIDRSSLPKGNVDHDTKNATRWVRKYVGKVRHASVMDWNCRMCNVPLDLLAGHFSSRITNSLQTLRWLNKSVRSKVIPKVTSVLRLERETWVGPVKLLGDIVNRVIHHLHIRSWRRKARSESCYRHSFLEHQKSFWIKSKQLISTLNVDTIFFPNPNRWYQRFNIKRWQLFYSTIEI